MTTEEFIKTALSFHGTIETPHFDKRAFKVTDRRIFATLQEENGTINMRLPVLEQPVFCSLENGAVYPVPNKWGQQGWTTFELRNVPDELIFNALEIAYNEASDSKKKKK